MQTDPVADYLTRVRNGLSSGLATIEVPSSKLKLEISRILTEQGYIAGFEKEAAEVAPGTVVNLVVASGKVTLTDLAGWTLAAATTNLESLGLTATPVESADCPATAPPTVVSMSVAPGDVPIGSPVELRYCTGE